MEAAGEVSWPLEGRFLLSSAAGTRTDSWASDPVAQLPSDDLVARVRELSLVVDSLWKDALNTPGRSQVLEIGEASQGLHRAMIALDSFFADGRLVGSVVDGPEGGN